MSILHVYNYINAPSVLYITSILDGAVRTTNTNENPCQESDLTVVYTLQREYGCSMSEYVFLHKRTICLGLLYTDTAYNINTDASGVDQTIHACREQQKNNNSNML